MLVPQQITDLWCDHSCFRSALSRHHTYVDGLPRTVSKECEKRMLIAAVADLRTGAYDLHADCWP
jgi:hypothetical protein